MMKSILLLIPLSLVLMLVSNVVEAGRPPICEITYCSEGCYEGSFFASDVSTEICDKSDGPYVGRLYPNASPPEPALLRCERVSNGYGCEAWPQNQGFNYLWSVSGAAWFSSSADMDAPELPFRSIGCSGSGSVTVTVVAPAPSNMTASSTSAFSCNSDEHAF